MLAAGSAVPKKPQVRHEKWMWGHSDLPGKSFMGIAGVEGQFGKFWTNGMYDIEIPENPADPPAWTLRNSPYERWVYFDEENRWRIGSEEYKSQHKAGAGSMRSVPVDPGTLPTEVKEWEVRINYSEWVNQDVQVKFLKPPSQDGRPVRAMETVEETGDQ